MFTMLSSIELETGQSQNSPVIVTGQKTGYGTVNEALLAGATATTPREYSAAVQSQNHIDAQAEWAEIFLV